MDDLFVEFVQTLCISCVLEMINEKISSVFRNLNSMASKDGQKDLEDSALIEGIQSFFDSAPPLRNLSEICKKLKDFIERYSTHLGDLLLYLSIYSMF